MQVSQQIIGVNDRLGNPAVANMQGTTRAIFDILEANQNNNFTFFQNVQTRPFPFSNISQNRFEVGESLAIESIALVLMEEGYPDPNDAVMFNQNFDGPNSNPVLNFYIGNQRVIKDLDLSYSQSSLGTTNITNTNSIEFAPAVFRLETPIVIPPQIEFYATLQLSVNTQGSHLGLILQGTGTLLNPKSNF